MLAGDDQFTALTVDMAQRGFGGGDAVQPDWALLQLDIHGGSPCSHRQRSILSTG
jgi:hypothetical protein